MRSSNARRAGATSLRSQRGVGLVEVLVACAILGISMAVMLANMSTMVIGARVADRRTAEERLVRQQIETLMGSPPSCPPGARPAGVKVDGAAYTVEVQPHAFDTAGNA